MCDVVESDDPGSLSATSSTVVPTTTEPAAASTTTTILASGVSTSPFSIEIGPDGVTYELDGSPPSGPTSFAVLDDGSVVVADTMAVVRGEPRLLRYDRTGELVAIIDLAADNVASIVDVVTNGSELAILDILVSASRYRVLTLSAAGTVQAAMDIPSPYRLEDGLTGLAWDDSGILLEFEFGARYVRLAESGAIESPVVPVFDGIRIELTPGSGRTTEVVAGPSTFLVERETDLGGATLIGIGPDGSVVVAVDEVDTSGPAIRVLRRVQRYTAAGDLQTEHVVDAADQVVDIPRPFELDATGEVLYLRARSDRVTIGPLDQ